MVPSSQPQPLHLDLLELAWWQYPQFWIGVTIFCMLLFAIGAYWWWIRLQKSRKPQTLRDVLRSQLEQVRVQCMTNALTTYEEQKDFFERITRLLHQYGRVCLLAPQDEMTDSELVYWVTAHGQRPELATLFEPVLAHGKLVKFAGQTLDPELLHHDVQGVIDFLQKELELPYDKTV